MNGIQDSPGTIKNDTEQKRASRVRAAEEITFDAKTLAKKPFSRLFAILITKGLTRNGIFCFITNHFGLHPFPESPKKANGDYCRRHDCEWFDCEMQLRTLTAVHL